MRSRDSCLAQSLILKSTVNSSRIALTPSGTTSPILKLTFLHPSMLVISGAAASTPSVTSKSVAHAGHSVLPRPSLTDSALLPTRLLMSYFHLNINCHAIGGTMAAMVASSPGLGHSLRRLENALTLVILIPLVMAKCRGLALAPALITLKLSWITRLRKDLLRDSQTKQLSWLKSWPTDQSRVVSLYMKTSCIIQEVSTSISQAACLEATPSRSLGGALRTMSITGS